MSNIHEEGIQLKLCAIQYFADVEPWSPNLVAGYHADTPTSFPQIIRFHGYK